MYFTDQGKSDLH